MSSPAASMPALLGWESLRARVIVKVDEIPQNEPRPDVYSFQVKVYRGDTPSGTEYVAKGRAEFAYLGVDPGPSAEIVALHEFGHLLGLDDGYNRGGNSSRIMFTMRACAGRGSSSQRAPQALVQTACQPTDVTSTTGRGLLDRMLELDWLQRNRNSRAIDVTERGRQGLAETFAITLA